MLGHRAARLVQVTGDDDPVAGGQVEIPEDVALGQRDDEQFLGVPPVPVTAERGVGGARDDRLPGRRDVVRPAVGAPVAGAGPVLPVQVRFTR